MLKIDFISLVGGITIEKRISTDELTRGDGKNLLENFLKVAQFQVITTVLDVLLSIAPRVLQ